MSKQINAQPCDCGSIDCGGEKCKQRINQLERELNDSTELNRIILTTLRVNFLRGTIKTDDDTRFEAMLNEWSKPSDAMPNGKSGATAD